MIRTFMIATLLAGTALSIAPAAVAGQAPFAASALDVPISHRDRVYAAEQFSNTVSVIDPAANALLGVIRLGDPQPTNFAPRWIAHRGLRDLARKDLSDARPPS